MYGDCQVLSNMGGDVVPTTETLFSSSSTQNPNFNFMPFQPLSPVVPKEEKGLGLRGKEGIESGSGSEHIEEKSGNEQEIDETQQPPKKKRYHRHTVRQIQEMEAMFKECPHPDDKQRQKLSQELGLKPRQVKFWFQNRRTQMKAQQDRSDNAILRAENESLKNENYRLLAALRNIICPNCGGPAFIGDPGLDEHQIHLENVHLKEELDRVCVMTSRYTGRPMETMGAVTQSLLMSPSLDLDMNIYSRHLGDAADPMGTCTEMIPVPMLLNPESRNCQYLGPEESSNNGGILIEEEKSIAMQLAMSSMNELLKMYEATEPLWISENGGKEVLNVEEHARMFPWPLKELPSASRIEATRDTTVVIMNSITLVDAFLDAEKWMDLFPSIVSKARTVEVISSDPSRQAISGTLQLMYAELQVISPLVPTREAYFMRYCQQNVEEGTWVIVDYPIDSLNYENWVEYCSSFPKYKRRCSGCVIEDMPNGYSRVTWVEHAEIEDKPIHQTFSQLVHSGMAFGAHRWLAVLQCQCERLASLMARNISDLGVIPSAEARKKIMKLAQRMIRTFSVNISTCGGQSWTALSDSPEDTVRITTRKITDPGQPNGVILSAVSTTWLPYSHFHVFDLLRDERHRTQLDVISNGNSLQEVAHIANGSHPGNCISLLRINVASNSAQNVELMLQESCTDKSGSLVVYTMMDVDSIQLAMNGEDPCSIPLLPIGFVMIPVESISSSTNATADSISSILSSEDNIANSEPNTTTNGVVNSGQMGCLLTVGIQVLASTSPSAKLNLSSVTAINNLLCNTVQQIASALSTTIPTTTTNNNNNNLNSFENITHYQE